MVVLFIDIISIARCWSPLSWPALTFPALGFTHSWSRPSEPCRRFAHFVSFARLVKRSRPFRIFGKSWDFSSFNSSQNFRSNGPLCDTHPAHGREKNSFLSLISNGLIFWVMSPKLEKKKIEIFPQALFCMFFFGIGCTQGRTHVESCWSFCQSSLVKMLQDENKRPKGYCFCWPILKTTSKWSHL